MSATFEFDAPTTVVVSQQQQQPWTFSEFAPTVWGLSSKPSEDLGNSKPQPSSLSPFESLPPQFCRQIFWWLSALEFLKLRSLNCWFRYMVEKDCQLLWKWYCQDEGLNVIIDRDFFVYWKEDSYERLLFRRKWEDCFQALRMHGADDGRFQMKTQKMRFEGVRFQKCTFAEVEELQHKIRQTNTQHTVMI